LAPQTRGASLTERLIAMQKVVGSNPISRLENPPDLQVFFIPAVD
jgi:hypothetical protein